ncbi:hypothetical protein CRYUN_Cryun30bG0079500 [Craigia yunnanensis]
MRGFVKFVRDVKLLATPPLCQNFNLDIEHMINELLEDINACFGYKTRYNLQNILF